MRARILITGGQGQVARALASLAGETAEIVGRPRFDFDHPETIATVLREITPALVLNAAAWTAVDAAEAQPEAAYRANAVGPQHLATLCASLGTRLVHLSTDYVFDGTKGAPYVEHDPPNPTGVYGATKLQGERLAREADPRTVVVRTAWVYDTTGRNFLRTMLNAANTRDEVRVVADQRGCPTYAPDLAAGLWQAAQILLREPARPGGIYHLAGDGETTWHGFAHAIFEEAAASGRRTPTLVPIRTEEWPTPARRPADSRLDATCFARDFGYRMPAWRDALTRAMASLHAPASA